MSTDDAKIRYDEERDELVYGADHTSGDSRADSRADAAAARNAVQEAAKARAELSMARTAPDSLTAQQRNDLMRALKQRYPAAFDGFTLAGASQEDLDRSLREMVAEMRVDRKEEAQSELSRLIAMAQDPKTRPELRLNLARRIEDLQGKTPGRQPAVDAREKRRPHKVHDREIPKGVRDLGPEAVLRYVNRQQTRPYTDK